MKVSYQQAAADDVIRQFRYYLLDVNLPEIALSFRESVRRTVELLRKHPHIGPRYQSENPLHVSLRSWPVKGFEAIRIYYVADEDTLRVIRILHGKRDVKRILERKRDQ